MSLGRLRTESDRLLKKLDELADATPVDQTVLDATEVEFNACEAEIIKKETEQAAATGAMAGTTNPSVKHDFDEKEEKSKAERSLETQQLKNMVNIITTDVPKFTSAVCVHGWLNTLQAYYNLYVNQSATNKSTFETHFVQSAMSKIQPDYLNAMVNGSQPIRTFEAMKKYLKDNHSSKLSIYQVLDTVWELPKLDVENLRDYGHRLDDKATEARGIIEAIFDNTIGANDASKRLTAEGVFKLVSGQVFLQYLKTKECNVYNHIVNDLDSTWAAAEIALKAMSYSDRLKADESEHQAPTLKATFNASVKQKKSEIICRGYAAGRCNFGNKCKYKHDDDLRKYLAEFIKPKPEDGAIATSGQKKGKKDKNKSNNTAHHVEKVALPTVQGFQ